MNLRDLKDTLAAAPDATFRILLPSGRAVPAEFHVTEVGHVVKRFIDCGGTVRSAEACVLQTWVAENDADHRLAAGKLSRILAMAGALLPDDGIAVEIEHEDTVISQYPLVGAETRDGVITLTLGAKHTDCLAKETCGLSPVRIGAPVRESSCGCQPGACC